VYYDETNFNLYCKRSQGRAKKGERACVIVPSSKGPNLQLQCAVSSAVGLVHYEQERGSIRMDQNATFVDAIYSTVKELDDYRTAYAGKRIVIMFDNAQAHCQTESRVNHREDLVLLRLGPYSPMCNPIEGCFSSFKAKVKHFLRVHHEDMFQLAEDAETTMTEQRRRLLERAADYGVRCIDTNLVSNMALNCMNALNSAARFEGMQYGV
jgi:hypothetical protein